MQSLRASEPLLSSMYETLGVSSAALSKRSVLAWVLFVVVAWIGTIFSLKTILDSPTFFGTDDPGDLGPVTPLESLSLIMYHFCRPVCVLLLVPLTHAVINYSLWDSQAKQTWLLAMLGICVAHMCYGTWMARTVLQCGVVFCWLPGFKDGGFFPWDQSLPKESGPRDGMGLRANEGLLTVMFALTLFIAFLGLLVRLHGSAAVATEEHQRLVDTETGSLNAQRHILHRKQGCAAIVLAFVVIPACFLLTAVMPNNFQKLHLVGGEESYRLPLAMNMTPPDAEIPGAWLKSTYVRVSDGLVLKFWVDTMIFYGFLEILALLAAFATIVPCARVALAKQRFASFSGGEILISVLFLCMFTMWNYYWAVEKWFGHLEKEADGKTLDWKFNTGGGVKPGPVNDIWESVARVLGMDSILFMSMLLLPASKNSLWLEALGISWERGLWSHRWMGIAMLITMAGHALAFWVRWWKLDILFHDLLHTMRYYPIYPGHPTPNHPSDTPGVYGANMTIILMEAVGYPALVIMGILPLLRRRSYEIFKYFHYWFLVLIPATIIHAHNGWYFPLCGIAFWLVDSATRIIGSGLPCRLVAAKAFQAEDGISQLVFEKKFNHPGMFCWINVPQISLLQWHPFSLSSSPLDGLASMHIKNMGENQFTGKLYSLIKMSENGGAQIKLNVDGPYGEPLELSGYSALLLIAGGIGITPMLSTARYVMQLGCASKLPAELKKVRLIFVAKSHDLVQVFVHSLRDVLMEKGSQLEFSMSIYLTGCEEGHQILLDGIDADVLGGRPNFGEVYDNLLGDLYSHSSVSVKVCGPESMNASALAAARLRPQIIYESKAFVI